MSKALRAGGCLESGYFIQRQKVGGPGESWWMELTTLLQLLKGTGGGSGRDLGKQRKRRRVLVLYGSESAEDQAVSVLTAALPLP